MPRSASSGPGPSGVPLMFFSKRNPPPPALSRRPGREVHGAGRSEASPLARPNRRRERRRIFRRVASKARRREETEHRGSDGPRSDTARGRGPLGPQSPGEGTLYRHGLRLAEGSEVLDLPVTVLLGDGYRRWPARKQGGAASRRQRTAPRAGGPPVRLPPPGADPGVLRRSAGCYRTGIRPCLPGSSPPRLARGSPRERRPSHRGPGGPPLQRPFGVWTSLRLDAGEQVLQFGADGNTAVVVTSSRVIGFSAPLSSVDQLRLPQDESVEKFQVRGNQATVVTRRRALGFSAITGKWHAVDRFYLGR